MIKDNEYHKAFNQGIVPIALAKYYIDGIKPEETIRNHENIYDFCKTFNATGTWKCALFEYDENNNEINRIETQKNNRYYISKEGKKFRKYKEDVKINKETGEEEVYLRVIDVAASDLVIIFNKFEKKQFNEYKVDYDYYIKECYKIIDTISGEKERALFEKKEQLKSLKIQRETQNYLDFCIKKNPTQKQYDMYRREYLIEEYGEPSLIKSSRNQLSLFDLDGEDIKNIEGLFTITEKAN